MDTKIKASFWSDATVENLDPGEKLAILWLFTANVSHCGWATATLKRFEFETGLKWHVLESATTALGTALVKGKDGWWIRNYIRHQVAAGDQLAKNNMRFPIKASMAFVPSTIVTEIIAEYPTLYANGDTPPPPLPPVVPHHKSRAEQSRAEVLSVGKEGAGGKPPPTEKEVLDYAAGGDGTVIISRDCALRWFTDRETADWMRPKGQHMLPVLPNWQADLRGYAMDWNQRRTENNHGSKSRPPTPQRRDNAVLNLPGRYE